METMLKTLILTGWSNSLHVGIGHHAEAAEISPERSERRSRLNAGCKGGNQTAEDQGQLEI